jgi:hypothetical protein
MSRRDLLIAAGLMVAGAVIMLQPELLVAPVGFALARRVAGALALT